MQRSRPAKDHNFALGRVCISRIWKSNSSIQKISGCFHFLGITSTCKEHKKCQLYRFICAEFFLALCSEKRPKNHIFLGNFPCPVTPPRHISEFFVYLFWSARFRTLDPLPKVLKQTEHQEMIRDDLPLHLLHVF